MPEDKERNIATAAVNFRPEQPSVLERFPRRTESRFVISPQDIAIAEAQLLTLGFKRLLYETPGVVSVYFTSELVAPSGGFVRLRKYVPEDCLAGDSITLDTGEEWFLEVKLTNGEKERAWMSFGQAFQLINEDRKELFELLPSSHCLLSDFENSLVPIAATRWNRSHLALESPQIRVTIDEQIEYFGFLPGNLTARFMGYLEWAKLELKDNLEATESSRRRVVQALGDTLSMKPIADNWHETEMRRKYAFLFSNQKT